MTLLDELKRRRMCRVGLAGLTVTTPEYRAGIRSTAWQADGTVLVHLDNGDTVRPEDCELAESWPVRYCGPKPGKSKRIFKYMSELKGRV